MGGAVSIYLAAYQYGGLADVWEPFFGKGSTIVLHSGLLDPISHALGIILHDAALGAAGYGLEAALAFAWKLNPPNAVSWLDYAYCGLVSLMGLTGLILVILQATVIHAFCTLCLTSAAISEAIVLLTFPEMIGLTHFLIRSWCTHGSRSQRHH